MKINRAAAQILSTLPRCHPASVIGERHLLVIAPHPDDESLGCGGLLAWAARTRRMPRVLFLTDGEHSHPDSQAFPPERLGPLRRQEAIEACKALGLKESSITFLGLPDAGLHALGQARRHGAICALRAWMMLSPRAAVCVTARSDEHGDHQVAHGLAVRALFGQPQHQLFAYPVWTWLRSDDGGVAGHTGWRIDIGPFLDSKRTALAHYATQHGLMVTDASAGFVLPQELLERAHQDYEVLLDAHF